MSQLPVTRAAPTPRTLMTALVLALCSALLVAAAPASAVSRKQAAKSGLAALGSRNGSDPVVVFALRKPLRAGTRITESCGSKRVAKVNGERSYFIYEDSAPNQGYQHPG